MKHAAILLCLILGLAPDDKEDLAKAAAKTRELENYRFKGEITVTGVPFLAEPVAYDGAYVKDRGFLATMGPFGSIFRLDKKVAVKDPDSGTWILLKPGTKIGEGELAAQIPIIARGLKAPHDELKKFEERFTEIKKLAAEKIGDAECAVYEGPLTEGGVRGALPAGVGLLLGKGKFEGKCRAWVGPDGRIVRIVSEGKAEIEDKERTMELTFSRTVDYLDVGKAKVEMPPEVKKLFEE
jgi:hypothetical protein